MGHGGIREEKNHGKSASTSAARLGKQEGKRDGLVGGKKRNEQAMTGGEQAFMPRLSGRRTKPVKLEQKADDGEHGRTDADPSHDEQEEDASSGTDGSRQVIWGSFGKLERNRKQRERLESLTPPLNQSFWANRK